MHASTPLILRKSRMRRRARTDLCGGRSAMVVPTATVTPAGPTLSAAVPKSRSGKSLGRVVAKPPTESRRHAVGHKKGLGVLRPSGGANAVAGCWPTYRYQSSYKEEVNGALRSFTTFGPFVD